MCSSPFDAPGDLKVVHIEKSVIAKVGRDILEADVKVLFSGLET